MVKQTKSAGKAGTKSKLPKRIDGMRISKGLRKLGSQLVTRLRNPKTADVAAAVLVAIAVALKDNPMVRDKAGKVKAKAGKLATGAGRSASEFGTSIADRARKGGRKGRDDIVKPAAATPA